MKRVGQLMKEMGFNADAPDSVKEAFIKHLIRASEGVNVATPSERRQASLDPNKVRPLVSEPALPNGAQLEFDFESVPTERKNQVG